MAKERKKRRASGEGSVFKLPNGRWRASVPYYVVIAGQKRRRYRTAERRTQREALEARDQLLRDQGAGVVAPVKQSVKQYLDNWITTVVQPNRASGTVRMYRESIERIESYLGPIALNKLAVDQIDAMLAQMRREKTLDGRLRYNVTTIRRAYDVLRNALNVAVKKRIIRWNPVLAATPPSAKQYEAIVLDESELQRLFAAIKDDRLIALYAVLVGLGLRPAEALGLRRTDLDLAQRSLAVRYQLNEQTLEFKPLKTDDSQRTLPLSDALVRILGDHEERMRQERAFFRNVNSLNLLFCSREGTPLRENNVRRHFKRHLKVAGLPTAMRLYDLRHTFNTLMLQRGHAAHIVAAFMGHSSTEMTLERYAHAIPAHMRAAAPGLDDLLEAVG